ncbi:hypothetical protein ECFDA507_5823, partial [Escherichia coli FDA507]
LSHKRMYHNAIV